MESNKKQKNKARLHIRNKNREKYDLDALVLTSPELKKYVNPNKNGIDTIDFSDAIAVKLLNKAILNHYYGIENWDFPDENLCPPIPGRADYIHHIADLLSEENKDKIPVGQKITCLDVGVGANCIYPIIGVAEYNWHFIGSDVDKKSIEIAKKIIAANPSLKGKIKCKLQSQPKLIFDGILSKEAKIEVSICNPPFHTSNQAARKANLRKAKNISGKPTDNSKLNFSGTNKELVYEGGDFQFIKNMMTESKLFSKNCYWFTSLVSKKATLKRLHLFLRKLKVIKIKTITMGTGNKSTQIIAWTFLSKRERAIWREVRWGKTMNK